MKRLKAKPHRKPDGPSFGGVQQDGEDRSAIDSELSGKGELANIPNRRGQLPERFAGLVQPITNFRRACELPIYVTAGTSGSNLKKPKRPTSSSSPPAADTFKGYSLAEIPKEAWP